MLSVLLVLLGPLARASATSVPVSVFVGPNTRNGFVDCTSTGARDD